MAKQLRQFRYYGNNSSENFPENGKDIDYSSAYILFTDNNFPSLAALGIQTIPGVKFYLNDSTDAIIVGHSGIFELSSTNKYEVTSLRFDAQSLRLIDNAEKYLIVDIIYNTKR
jgi:hypothetical protein